MMKRVAIYARVSTDKKGQDPESQLQQLRSWCERMDRPRICELRAALRLAINNHSAGTHTATRLAASQL
jgi:predicted site-specific integrase-resolvase